MGIAEMIALGFSLVEQGTVLIKRVRTAAQQSGEWTAEQEADFQARLNTAFTSDAWKTDAELKA